MDPFQEPETIPKWRLVFWGVVTAVAADAIIYFLGTLPGNGPTSPFFYLAGPLAGAFITGIAFVATSPEKGKLRYIFFKGCCLISSLLFIFIAGLATHDGHISIGKATHRREIYEAKDPGYFWFQVIFFFALGIGLMCGVFKKRNDNT